jgi:competence protein ComEC
MFANAAIGLSLVLPAMFVPSTVAAAGCIRFIASQFDAPGIEASHLNGEWVRIKNVCVTRHSVGGWKIHDYHRNHTYRFPDTFRIGAGATVTLYTGSGDSTKYKRYWGLDAPVWNNAPPEWAYLRRPNGTLMSKWTEY